MALTQLTRLVDNLPDFKTLTRALLHLPPKPVLLEGLANPAKGFFLARLFTQLERPIFVLTHTQEAAQRLWEDLTRYGVSPDDLALLPSVQSVFLEGDLTDYRAIGERIGALQLLAREAPGIVIGTVEAALQKTAPPEDLLHYCFTLEAGTEIDLSDTVTLLVQIGYSAATTVTRPGEFSRRGGILDVFPGAAETPVRIELFGDEIESIRPFDVVTQRSTGKRASVEITPARELRLTQARVEAGVKAIEAEFRRRKAELSADGGTLAREAVERLTDRIERDLTALRQSAYFPGLEQYLSYLLSAERRERGEEGSESSLPRESRSSTPPHQAEGASLTPPPAHPPHSRSAAPTALDYLRPETVVFVDETGQVQDHYARSSAEAQSNREHLYKRGEILDLAPHNLPLEAAQECLKAHPTLLLSLLGRKWDALPPAHTFGVNSAPMDSYRGRLSTLADDLTTWIENGCRVVLVSDTPGRVRQIAAELRMPVQPREKHAEDAPGLYVEEGRLRAGFKVTELRLYVLTDAELFGSTRPVVSRRKVAGGVAISSVLDLKEFDHVVHIHHGVGLYRGLVKRKVETAEKDYLLVEYSGGDRLYVPADQIDRIQRYVGTDGNPPQVNKIGGQEWNRTKRKVKEQAKQMAGELIRLYAARQASQRPSYGPDTDWQDEMEDAFPYEETRDQLRAIQDVKKDLQGDKPMDRLICGDVGFGKTEVALRGAFKVVTAGKQVAILCPTTVLAAQHFTSFTERFGAYPLRIELLSRFRSPALQKKTIAGLKDGSVDIVIGTHRLLSKDVEFANLGLVVVDEEQRFGVGHKEKLKQLRTAVDVLTLSATPIPRTLSLALAGLRDMSVIEEAPPGRLPVLTSVREYDEDLVRDAIGRELERQGQVYFIHNKVESITHVAERLRKLVPEARIAIGHGQMPEEELERVMAEFYHQEADILLCTTIVENGLDVSNANTIILDNADHMGLSQLYQLRGRVGRSPRQAYAYLLYRRNKQLSEVAERRLSAMKEFAALGSGTKVAMRDLEIRGAGNLLGAEQSGAMVSVGFDLYCQLISNAVQEMQGEEVVEDILPAMDLPISASIPTEYIPGEAERIYFYKRMSGVRAVPEVEALQAELEDRFGDPPRPVWDALAVLRLRLKCREIGISSVKVEGEKLFVRFAGSVRLSPDTLKLLSVAFRGITFLSDGLSVPLTSPKVLLFVEETMASLEKALAYKRAPALR